MRKQSLYFLVIVLVSVLLGGCVGGIGGGLKPSTYSVKGIVVNFTDNQPVAGVEIVSDCGRTAITDEMGMFSLSGLDGKVILKPILEGWKFVPEESEVTKATEELEFKGYREEEAKSGSIKVSFVGSYGIKPAMHKRPHFKFGPEIYRDEFQEPGQITGVFTPHKFIVNLQDIGVAHPNYRLPLLFAPGIALGEYSGFRLPIHFDLASNREVIDASYIIEYQALDFQAVEVLFFTHDQTSDDGLTFKSEIHVDLGEKYRGVVLANELPERAYGTTHVFQLKDLIPLQNPDKARVVFLVFASYVDEPFILNPDASYLERHDVHEWSTGGNTGQAGYAIYLPGFELQFADDLENHLIFSWDLQGLIEVYDNNTEDDLSDDLVTLRLDDPFPIEMYLETEYTYEEPAVEDRIADDVTHVEIEFFDLMEREIAIGWVNPSDPQYLTTHVVRKVGSAPASLDDGELLYSGTFPMFKDMEVELGQHYYYRIFTESRAGLLSEGKVIDIITSLPDIIDMEFIEGY